MHTSSTLNPVPVPCSNPKSHGKRKQNSMWFGGMSSSSSSPWKMERSEIRAGKRESQSFSIADDANEKETKKRSSWKKQYHLIEYDVDLSGISRSGYPVQRTHSRQVITFNIYLFHINKSYIFYFDKSWVSTIYGKIYHRICGTSHTHPLCARDMSRLRAVSWHFFSRQTNTDGKHDNNFSSSLTSPFIFIFRSVFYFFIHCWGMRGSVMYFQSLCLCRQIERLRYAYAWDKCRATYCIWANHFTWFWISFRYQHAARSRAAQLTMK